MVSTVPSQGSDLLVTHARPWCPVQGALAADAIWIRGGRIQAFGSGEWLLREAPSETPRLDAGGKRVTPGLHDAHAHVTDGGLSLLQVDARAPSLAALLERVRNHAAALPPGAWVLGRGWDELELTEGRPPSPADLDEAAAGRPVLLRRVCGHAAVANSAALAAAGLLPPASAPPGGRIELDACGRPTGLIFERAVDRVLEALPPPSVAERLEGIRRCLAQARRFGLTSLEDERGDPALYLRLMEEDGLTARVRIWHRITTPLPELRAWRAGFPRDPRIRPGLLKGYLDGSLGARTAWFHEPYTDCPSSCGMPVLEAEALMALAPERHDAGFQIGLHAIGDRAVRTALECFLALSDRAPGRALRHRVEHAQHVRVDDMPLFGKAGAIASMQPSHLASDARMARERLGAERLRGAYAWRSLARHGAVLAFGSDFPIEPIDPRTSLHAACTRRPRGGGEPLVPLEERLDIETALFAFTYGAAFAAHREHELGSLQPGRFGDLVIWGEDPLQLPPERLLNVPIDRTILGGEIVYERANCE